MIQVVLLAIVISFLSSASACGQSSRRLVPSESPKHLVVEGSQEEGIIQITIGELYKQGTTSYAAIDRKTLNDLPPLPTGFVLFRDRAYRVTTEAMIAGEHTIVFHLPSVDDQAEFNRLEVLHLEDDEMSPLGKSWAVVTVAAGAWDKDTFQFISKQTYDQLLPNFSTRRITAITTGFGVFAIAIAPQSFDQPKEAFTQMELVSTSIPEIANMTQEITHSFVIKNNGPVRAGEVNFKEELNTGLRFESATASQGRCVESNRSGNRVVCHLGPMAAGATATVSIKTRVNEKTTMNRDVEETLSLALLVFKERPADLVGEKNQRLVEVRTAIAKHQQ